MVSRTERGIPSFHDEEASLLSNSNRTSNKLSKLYDTISKRDDHRHRRYSETKRTIAIQAMMHPISECRTLAREAKTWTIHRRQALMASLAMPSMDALSSAPSRRRDSMDMDSIRVSKLRSNGTLFSKMFWSGIYSVSSKAVQW